MNGKMSPEWVTKWSEPGCWFRAFFPPDNYPVLFFVRAWFWPDLLSPHLPIIVLWRLVLSLALVSSSWVLTAVSGPLPEAGHWGCPAGLWCWAKMRPRPKHPPLSVRGEYSSLLDHSGDLMKIGWRGDFGSIWRGDFGRVFFLTFWLFFWLFDYFFDFLTIFFDFLTIFFNFLTISLTFWKKNWGFWEKIEDFEKKWRILKKNGGAISEALGRIFTPAQPSQIQSKSIPKGLGLTLKSYGPPPHP